MYVNACREPSCHEVAQLPYASGYLSISSFLSTLGQSPLSGAGARSAAGSPSMLHDPVHI